MTRLPNASRLKWRSGLSIFAPTQARVDQLADKANEGELSNDERAEYDKFREAFHFVTILQAKARTLLDRQTAS